MTQAASRIDRRRDRKTFIIPILYIASSLFVLITLFMVYKIPYNGDDMINSLTDGGLMYSNRNVWDHTFSLMRQWMDSGRFYPLAFYSYAMFTACSSLFLYRTFQIVLVFACVLSAAFFIHRLSGSHRLAIVAILITPVFFQFRYYQDPIIAYHGMLQFVALYLLWAGSFAVIGYSSGKYRYHFIGAVLFACAMMTYEISYAFLLAFLVLPFFYMRGKKAVLSTLPYVGVTAIILTTTLILRAIAPNPTYAGISFSFDAYGLIKAFLSQISAAIPMSYYLLATPTFLIYGFKAFVRSITPGDICLALALFAGLAFVLAGDGKDKPDKKILWTGLMFWILPATILSLSARYQTEISPGVGYLPVFVQYFGGVMIAVYLLRLLLSRVNQPKNMRILAFVFAFCFSIGFLMNQVNNRTVGQVFYNQNTQALSQYALESELLSSVDEGDSFLLLSGGYGMDFEPTSFVYKYSDGLRIIPKKIADLHADAFGASGEVGGLLTPTNLWVYQAFGDLQDGAVQIAKVNEITYDPSTMIVERILVSEIQLITVGRIATGFLSNCMDTDGNLSPMSFSIGLEGYEPLDFPLNLTVASSSATPPVTAIAEDYSVQESGLHSVFALDRATSTTFRIQAGEGVRIQFPMEPV